MLLELLHDQLLSRRRSAFEGLPGTEVEAQDSSQLQQLEQGLAEA